MARRRRRSSSATIATTPRRCIPGAAADYGPGFISGTHTAWRHKNYVFIADEVFPPFAPSGTWDVGSIRAYGRLQVVDVSDIEKPKSVAWYEPEYGGVHNVWAAGDTLYIGAYNAGFHVRGRERRAARRPQGAGAHHRDDAAAATTDGVVPNRTMTWGVVVKDGLAYVNDMITGLVDRASATAPGRAVDESLRGEGPRSIAPGEVPSRNTLRFSVAR